MQEALYNDVQRESFHEQKPEMRHGTQEPILLQQAPVKEGQSQKSKSKMCHLDSQYKMRWHKTEAEIPLAPPLKLALSASSTFTCLC